jgi:hypothetical protein
MRGRIIVSAAALLALTGCVSAKDVQSGAASVAPNPTPNASARCDLFTTTQLQALLRVEFSEAVLDPASTQSTTQCQWTAKDQASLVLTKVAAKDAAFLYRESETTSQQSLGVVTSVTIPGAREAYQLPSLGRTAMLVGDQMIEVTVLVPSATAAQVNRTAALAAQHAKRS